MHGRRGNDQVALSFSVAGVESGAAAGTGAAAADSAS